MKSRFTLSLLLLFLLCMFKPAIAEEAGTGENLARLIDTALANNPEIKASEARWQMFRNRVRHEGRLEDPMLMLKIQNGIVTDPLNFKKDGMTQKVIGLSQQLPFWGKRGLREEVAAKEAESYKWAVEERKLELTRMVKETFYQLYFVDKSLEIVARNIRILDDFTTLAETRYSVGQGAQQDVFKAQVERSKMLDMRISLEGQRKSLQANLNALLYRPADTPVGRIPEPEIKPLPLSSAQLKGVAIDNRPLLKSLDALIEKGQAGNKLAEKEFYPDFTVSLEYMQRDPVGDEPGNDMYSLGVTFNLPVYRHHRHEMLAEADASVRMAAEELNSLKNSIDSGISDLLAQLERRRKLVELYRTGIIPQAEQSLESAAIGYRVNKVDFLTLLDSRMTLFNYEREIYDSLADYQMKKAQLEALIGKEIP
jgi:cobalt-zinc-cadmium efflux system outer membrane protein